MLYASNLKKIRKSKKITQAKLAKALGKSQNTVNKWENGKRNPCNSDIRIIADILGVAVEQISDIKPNYDSIFIDSYIMRLNSITQEFGKGLSDIDIIAINDLRETVEGLRRENGRLKKQIRYKNSFLDSIDSYAYVIDKNFNFVDINTTFLNCLDKLEGEVLNHSWSTFFKLNDITEILKIQNDVFTTEKPIKNKKVKLPKNKLGLLSIIPDEYDSYQNLATAICIIKDITLEEELHRKHQQEEEKRKEAEEEQRLLKLSIENARMGCWIKEVYPKYRYRYSNNAIHKTWGWPTENFIKNPNFWKQCIYHEDFEKVKDNNEKVTETPLVFRIVRQNGEIRWIEETITEATSPEGEIIKLGIEQDITDSKRSLETFNKAEKDLELLNFVLNNLADVIWIASYNPLKFLHISEGVYPILGFTKHEIYIKPDLWFKKIHPKQKEKVKKLFLNNSAKPQNIEYQIVHKNRTNKNVVCFLNSLKYNKTFIRFGMLRNISDQ